MVKVGSARIDENGNISGGKPGDQTKKEVAIEPYYSHRQGWFMLRAKDVQVAKKIAQAMIEGCNNDNIGYDQIGRYGVINNLKIYGRIAKIAIKTEADCSSLVRACCIQAGINVGDFNTSSEVVVLENTGAFEKAVAVTPHTKLCEGDILVTRTKGHTVVVTEGASRGNTKEQVKPQSDKMNKSKEDIKTVAGEVICGKWGIGEDRKNRLIAAGYNYLEVQAVVNMLLK